MFSSTQIRKKSIQFFVRKLNIFLRLISNFPISSPCQTNASFNKRFTGLSAILFSHQKYLMNRFDCPCSTLILMVYLCAFRVYVDKMSTGNETLRKGILKSTKHFLTTASFAALIACIWTIHFFIVLGQPFLLIQNVNVKKNMNFSEMENCSFLLLCFPWWIVLIFPLFCGSRQHMKLIDWLCLRTVSIFVLKSP